MSELRLRSINYHRNGVSGEGFFLVTFTLGRTSPLSAVIPDALVEADTLDDDPALPEVGLVRVYVFDSANPDHGYRGDSIGRHLVPLVKQYREHAWNGKALTGAVVRTNL